MKKLVVFLAIALIWGTAVAYNPDSGFQPGIANELAAVKQNIIPATADTYTLGSEALPFDYLYVNGASIGGGSITPEGDIEMGNTPYSLDGGTSGLAFDPDNDGGNEATIDGSGNLDLDGTITCGSGSNAIVNAAGNLDGTKVANADLGDIDVIAGSWTLDTDVVAAAEMADADHGDVSWTDGVASVDDNSLGMTDIAAADYGDITIAADGTVTVDAGVDYSGSTTNYVPKWSDTDTLGNSVMYDDATNIGIGTTDPSALLDVNGVLEMGTLDIPTVNGDVALATAGYMAYDEAEEQLVVYDSQGGEITGEAVISPIHRWGITLDPGAWYDVDEEVFIAQLGDDTPNGIIIDEWAFSCNADPDVEIDGNIMYADALIGLANATSVDAIDTTNGTSSEDTDANINGGNAIPAGKVIYLLMEADPEGTCVQLHGDIWWHAEEN